MMAARLGKKRILVIDDEIVLTIFGLWLYW